ncbi:hypothetical protein DTO013E5_8520 [Penicillium roqueforti]|uniref:Genomic scaffold, ProqFM164S01 n=1 Tax=Penicillium roqueforti (strain FM164) TaxID=1365484 RepID=W6PUH5_PENRF|nr:uncharacterized protein LCP9604111_4486 [Penicillium roqueforti]CDM27411.1 unnamed protein product [Penicillium roqueforti FM164]KAF9249330.1 hypothetical protein LCP9604111_4486 [Penicillium roqueforti]KAI1834158.1 hypothetical protein CBS147337_5122 [Penicillium roqueforti]KAI2674948.1 hypothetical protein CBS147355_6762 [Penicillium roqueforti]KAI2699783.1 hypothetical protein CBS147372_6093 [Penicillium roqueforti]
MATNDARSVEDYLIPGNGPSDLARTGVFAAFAALAWYNSIELVILCFFSFRRWKGIYFWSLLISSGCIIPYTLGYVLLFFRTGVTPWLCVTLVQLGWYGMITGQSVVLWSRLHLVLQNRRLLRGVLWMICIDAVIFHIPTTVLLYGTVAQPASHWARAYNIMERVQLVGFCVQELIISSIYVWETIKLLHLRPEGRPHGILNQLLVINILILLLDISVVVIEYVGYYAIQVMFKPVAYSIKLKLEYAILGKLIAVARGGGSDSQEMHSSTREITESSSFPSNGDRPANRETPMRVRREYSPSWFGGGSSGHSTSSLSGVLQNP